MSAYAIPDGQVFDRRRHRLRRDRVARKFTPAHSFLKDRTALDFTQRLDLVKRRFVRILDLGAHSGQVLQAARHSEALAPDAFRVHMDCSQIFAGLGASNEVAALAADEEYLPFADGSFDLILSGLSLHWVNDLPGVLVRIRQLLSPDGLFIGSLLGGSSLYQLRHCLLEAEIALRQGAAQRVSPLVHAGTMASLLQRAGFAMPVVDSDSLSVRYASPQDLLADLRGMGERAIPIKPTPLLDRHVHAEAMRLYRDQFADPDGKVRACFEIITASGWSPGPGQPGSGVPGFLRRSGLGAGGQML